MCPNSPLQDDTLEAELQPEARLRTVLRLADPDGQKFPEESMKQDALILCGSAHYALDQTKQALSVFGVSLDLSSFYRSCGILTCFVFSMLFSQRVKLEEEHTRLDPRRIVRMVQFYTCYGKSRSSEEALQSPSFIFPLHCNG